MKHLAVAALLCGVASAPSPAAAQQVAVDEATFYRLKNADFARLGEDLCVDVFNGGDLNDQLQMTACENYSGQFWQFTSHPTALRHLATFAMTTAFRGAAMCLTVDGTLVDHVLRLAPCADPPGSNQLWSLAAGRTAGGEPGVTIEPMASADGEPGSPMFLVVNTPPEGDGRPYVDATDYVGDGAVWALVPTGTAAAAPGDGGEDVARRMFGRWRSLDDPRAAITLAPGEGGGLTQTSSYDGAAEEAEPAALRPTCAGMAAEPPGFLVVGAGPDPLCYRFTLDGDRLELVYLPRGNTLSYERVR